MAVAGPIINVSIDGRRFVCRADNDAEIDLGGSTVEVLPNADGSASEKHTMRPWGVSGVQVEIDSTTDDFEFLQRKADAPGFYPLTFELASGTDYTGEGKITGEVKLKPSSASAELAFMGTRKLRPQ